MFEVNVSIHEKDRKIGAMVKALAFEIGNKQAVVGASKEFLERNGYYVFHFNTTQKAQEFKDAVANYLPAFLAQCEGHIKNI
ncbi:MAG: hypothetical protein K4571_10320 [Deltaproteobacteria bacterium]